MKLTLHINSDEAGKVFFRIQDDLDSYSFNRLSQVKKCLEEKNKYIPSEIEQIILENLEDWNDFWYIPEKELDQTDYVLSGTRFLRRLNEDISKINI
mgnify:CR=1 FL=1|tara:strand:- start:10340 stop:10630 length:291 start_codon:yes stop_codon:yes gene_type:complete